MPWLLEARGTLDHCTIFILCHTLWSNLVFKRALLEQVRGREKSAGSHANQQSTTQALPSEGKSVADTHQLLHNLN